MKGALLRVWYQGADAYEELTGEAGIWTMGQVVWMDAVGLGLTLWQGCFEEDISRLWLRWCDRAGNIILTGTEGMEVEKARADRLATQLRALGSIQSVIEGEISMNLSHSLRLRD